MNLIILFDGSCNLCNGYVKFVIQRDKQGILKFASLQSDIGKALLKNFKFDSDSIDSIVFIQNDSLTIKSTAILNICAHLNGFWHLSKIFLMIPRCIRDFLYDFIATNRYRWFGKKTSCLIRNDNIKTRFLDQI